MKNMKIDKENKDMEDECCISEQDYPYGLVIDLEEQSIKKLGITELPEIGQKFILKSIVEVISVSNKKESDSIDRCIRLQITEMDLSNEKKENSSAESILYNS